MLLVIGLTQVSPPAAFAVIGWLFLLAWRGDESFQRRSNREFNLLQIVLMGLTLTALRLGKFRQGRILPPPAIPKV